MAVKLKVDVSKKDQTETYTIIQVKVSAVSTYGSWVGDSRSGTITISGDVKDTASFKHAYSANTTTVLATKTFKFSRKTSPQKFTATVVFSSGTSSGTVKGTDKGEIPALRKLTVVLDGNGGTTVKKQIPYGQNLVFPSSAGDKTGYTLRGWGDNKSSVTHRIGTSEKITKNKTFYAIWGVKNYTATFVHNSGNTPNTNITVPYGTTLTFPAVNGTVSGKSFVGWNQTDGATDAQYNTGDTLTWKYTTNKTYYGIWSDAAIAPVITNINAYRAIRGSEKQYYFFESATEDAVNLYIQEEQTVQISMSDEYDAGITYNVGYHIDSNISTNVESVYADVDRTYYGNTWLCSSYGEPPPAIIPDSSKIYRIIDSFDETGQGMTNQDSWLTNTLWQWDDNIERYKIYNNTYTTTQSLSNYQAHYSITLPESAFNATKGINLFGDIAETKINYTFDDLGDDHKIYTDGTNFYSTSGTGRYLYKSLPEQSDDSESVYLSFNAQPLRQAANNINSRLNFWVGDKTIPEGSEFPNDCLIETQTINNTYKYSNWLNYEFLINESYLLNFKIIGTPAGSSGDGQSVAPLVHTPTYTIEKGGYPLSIGADGKAIAVFGVIDPNIQGLTINNKTLGDWIQPVGSVYVGQDATNPNEIFGFGTWQLYDKQFRQQHIRYSDKPTIFDLNTTNFQNPNIVIGLEGHTVWFRFKAISKRDCNPNVDYALGVLNSSEIGITSTMWSTYIGGYMEYSGQPAGPAGFYLDYDGDVTKVVGAVGNNKTSAVSSSSPVNPAIVTGTEYCFTTSFQISWEVMDDSYCDKFYWRRIS